MRKLDLTKHVFTVAVGISLFFFGCSENEAVDVVEQEVEYEEVAMSAEIDKASETLDDLAIDAYEVQEASEDPTGRTGGEETFTLPDCVTVTIVVEQNSREITIDFGNLAS